MPDMTITPELFRNPISLFDNITDADIARHHVRLGAEFEMILSGEHPDRDHSNLGEEDYLQLCTESFIPAVGGTLGMVTTEYGEHRSEGYNKWHFTGDGSLDPNEDDEDNGSFGLELVSPVFDYADMFPAYMRVRKWAHEDDPLIAYTNGSCGMHVGVSSSPSPEKFDPVLFSLLVDDFYVLSKCDRSNNGYANPFYKYIFGNYSDFLREVLNQHSSAPLRKRMSDAIAQRGFNDRYSVNFANLASRGYVEYRSPGGNWLEHSEDFMRDLFHRISVSFLAAGGLIDHPLLNSIYESRLCYALQQPNHVTAAFPSQRVTSFPSLLHLEVDKGVSYQLPNSARSHFYLHLGINDASIWEAPRSHFRGVRPIYSLGEPSSLSSQFHKVVSFSEASRQCTPSVVGRAADRAASIRVLHALSSLSTWLRTHDTVSASMSLNMIELLQSRNPGRLLREYGAVVTDLKSRFDAFCHCASLPASKVSSRSLIHSLWLQNISERVRRAAMRAAHESVMEHVSLMPASQLLTSIVTSILCTAEQSGQRLSTSSLMPILQRSCINDVEVGIKNILLSMTFPECGVDMQTISSYVDNNALEFVSVANVMSVFAQPTDFTMYAELRAKLAPFLENTPSFDSAQMTRHVRSMLVRSGDRLARTMRHAWRVTGAVHELSSRLGTRAIKSVLLGDLV